MKEAAGDLQDHLSVMTAHPLLEMTVHQCFEEMTDLQQETEAVHGGHGAQMTHHHETTNLKRNPLKKAGKLLKGVSTQSTSTILTILLAAPGIKVYLRLKLLNEFGKEFW